MMARNSLRAQEHSTPMTDVAEKSSTGLDGNIAAALTYLPIVAIIFLVIEKGSRLVKFHAVQSLALCVAWIACWFAMMILGYILSNIPVLGFLINMLLSLAVGLGFFVAWIIGLIKAFQGQYFKLPFIGTIAEQQSQTL